MTRRMMTEVFRSRDCVMFFKGDLYTVTVSPAMLAQGWLGGQGVMWTAGVNDERTVTFSDGRFGGFVLWGSNEAADQHTAITESQETYRFATFCTGGCLISTNTYEQYTWASRTLGGPLVPIVYQANDDLYFSVRGWFTNEDEATLAALPHAPDILVGFVSQIPKENNQFYLGVQTDM